MSGVPARDDDAPTRGRDAASDVEAPNFEVPDFEAPVVGGGLDPIAPLQLPARPQERLRREGPPDGIGTRLRDRRIERALSLVEVERDTRINREYLAAIEAERFDVLPAPVYARGFVRSYARYLGLPEHEALAAMPREMPRPEGLEPLPGLRVREPSALPQIEPRLLGIGAAALLVIALIAFAVTRFTGGETEPLAGAVTAPPGATEAAGGASPAASTATAEATAVATPPPPLTAVPAFEEGTAPDFTGVARAVAQQTLDDLGIGYVVIEAANDDFAPGAVFAQSPAPGIELAEDEVMALIVARAEEAR